MKVVIASGIFPPEIGGPATYTKFVAEALTKRGWDVEVVTFSSSLKDSEEIKNQFIVKRIPYRGKRGLFMFFLQLLKSCKAADVIFAQGPLMEGIPSYVVSKLLKKPLVVRVPGDQAWESSRNKGEIVDTIEVFQRRKYGFKIELKKFIERRIIRSAKAVIVPSKYVRAIVEGWGVPEQKIHVIHNAACRTKAKTKEIILKIKQQIKQPYIISAGRFVPWKNFDVVIKAFKRIKPKHLKLLLMGEGPYENSLKEIADENVIFMRSLLQDEFLVYLENAEAFVLASDYEGQSHAILEAMSVRTAVVAADIPANREIIVHNESGLLFPLNDVSALSKSMKQITSDESLKRMLEVNAEKSLKGCSEEESINQLEEALLN